MLVTRYKEQGYLFNTNLTGELNGDQVYRGDLVLEFGEVTDRGDRKPPVVVAKQVALYTSKNKVNMLVGGLDRLSDIAMVTQLYEQDFAEGCEILFFVHDIKEPMLIPISGFNYYVVPLDDGMIWNETLELLCIEKSDLKGQSAAEKVATLLAELKNFKPSYPERNYETALDYTVKVKATARGPV